MKNYSIYVIIFFSIKHLKILVNCSILTKESMMANILGNIFEQCFNDAVHQNIFIGNDALFEKQILRELFSMYLSVQLVGSNGYSHSESVERNALSSLEKNITGNNFFIFATSIEGLRNHLKILKQSTWWNHEGFFLVINPVTNGCDVNDYFLRTMWRYNILSTVLVCLDFNRKSKLYTFNPYNDFAPESWKIVHRNNGLQNKTNQWFLFQYDLSTDSHAHSRIFKANKRNVFCKNLNFNKMKTLSGHTIKMGAFVHTNLLIFYNDKQGLERFGGVNGDITGTICKHLNATIDVEFYNKMGLIDDKGYSQSFLRDLQNNEIDFAINMNIMRTKLWKQQTYPHETSAFCIVTLKYPVNFFKKFESVFTVKVLIVVGITSFIVIFILKFVLKQPVALAILNLVKMLLVPSGLSEPPVNSAIRIFFLLIFFLTMITDVIIQGHLSAINMAPNTNSTIDSIADLMESNIPIYGTLSYNELLLGTNLTGRYEIKEYPKCIERLLRGEYVACIPGCIEARFSVAEDERFHISRNELRQFYMVFSVREDWPLLSRFDWILQRMSEAGLIKLFRERETRYFKHNFDTGRKANAINLKSLRFSFIVLMLGLFLSFCVLLIEVFINFLTPKVSKVREDLGIESVRNISHNFIVLLNSFMLRFHGKGE